MAIRTQIITWVLFLVLPIPARPQNGVYNDQVYKDGIKTVQIFRAGWELTYPVIELNSPDKVELNFDDLCDQVKNYSYSIEHCNAGWESSLLPEEDYLTGFNQNQFYDYALSFNTQRNYIHYRLKIPNEDIQLKISGNYLIRVFEDFDPDNLVLTRRFSVAEPLVNIQGTASKPVAASFSEDGQQVSFSIIHGNYPVNDPYSEILVSIFQNNRWTMSITNLKPLFIRDGVLDYNYQDKNIFPGGNEYRYFDIKSLRYQAESVKDIAYRAPYYHVELVPDQFRDKNGYFYQEDLNGRYFIEIQEGVKKDIESDYVYVHFTLLCEEPEIEGDMYVFGELANWECREENRMEYNTERKAYEKTLLLKQGYYNYEYALLREGTNFPDATHSEGSHYQTENFYLIYVYLRTQGSRYDRLIGYQILNSLRKNLR